ncbi:tetratricopeptide repeat protein [Candidatus Harpocratesius sp.]
MTDYPKISQKNEKKQNETSPSSNTIESNKKKWDIMYNRLSQQSVTTPAETEKEIVITLQSEKDSEKKSKLRLLLANIQWTLGKIDEAEHNYKIVFLEATRLDKDELLADTLVGLGMVENSSGRFQSASDRFFEALPIYQKLGKKAKEAHVYNRLGINRSYIGLLQEGEEYLHKAISLAQKNNNSRIEISARNNLALFQMFTGDIQYASEQFKQCAELAEKLHLTRDLTIMMSNYAETLQYLGDYSLAEKKYFKALQIAEQAQNHSNVAVIKSEIGGFYTELGQLTKARQFLDESMDLFKEVKMKFNFLQLLNNYAKYWLVEGNYLKSIELLQKALHIVENTQLNFQKIQILITLVQTHFALHNVDSAYTLLKDIVQLAWKQQNKVGIGLALIERARLSLTFSNFHEAEILLLEANRIGQTTKFFEIKINSLLLLALTYLIKTQQHRYSKELKEISDLIHKVLGLTKNKSLWPRYIDTLVLQATLYAFKGYLLKARKVLSLAEDLVVAHEIKNKQTQIERIENLIDRLDSNPLDREFILSQIYNLLMQEIQQFTTQGIQCTLSQEDINSIFMVCYKIDEKKGTVLHIVENVDENDRELQQPLQIAGNIFMVSLGQGHGYHQGLYGPFPFGRSNFRALVYSTMIHDSSQNEGRGKGSIFFITCFIYSQKLSALLNQREKIEQIFTLQFRPILDISDITTDTLHEIRENIIDFFLEPFLI